MKDLQNQVALITGGGRGLGESICHMLAQDGAIVIAADVRHELAKNVAADIQSHGGRAEALHLDVGDTQAVQKAIANISARYQKLDILINNAGVDVTLSVEELAVEDWDRILQVNLRGPFIMSKFVLPIMRRQGRGHIINVASTAAKRAWANASAYHASKWGLLGFSHALHVEARKSNVKVTAVVVGGMRTPFLLDRFPDIDINKLQDPMNVAETIRYVLLQPAETVIPEIMVLPMQETSWP